MPDGVLWAAAAGVAMNLEASNGPPGPLCYKPCSLIIRTTTQVTWVTSCCHLGDRLAWMPLLPIMCPSEPKLSSHLVLEQHPEACLKIEACHVPHPDPAKCFTICILIQEKLKT